MPTALTATEIARRLRERSLSATEVTDAFLKAIESRDAELHAYIHVDPESARRDALAAQTRLDAGDTSPLLGVPVALKDNMSCLAAPMSCGSRILEGYMPPFEATAVARCRESGMPILGKTNLDEFAMGTSTETSEFGPTTNPWGEMRSPGGSSGGSAAAVAAGLAPLALGSDTGGSIRLPAALCGVVGFKPTYGRVSRYGLVAFASSLDQIGPIGATVADAASLACAISGFDRRDSTSRRDSKIDPANLASGSLRGLRCALPRELVEGEMEPGVAAVFAETVETLRREGASCDVVDTPLLAYGVTTYYIIAPAEASSNLARFDGVRFGPRIEAPGHAETTSATRGALLGHEVKLRIMVGTYVLSAGYFDAYYQRAQSVRAEMARELERIFDAFDVIISPTSPSVAFPLGGFKGDPLALKLMDRCTIPANLGGFPSISIPCGLAEGLPVGLLLTSPQMADEALLQTAYCVEKALGLAPLRPGDRRP